MDDEDDEPEEPEGPQKTEALIETLGVRWDKTGADSGYFLVDMLNEDMPEEERASALSVFTAGTTIPSNDLVFFPTIDISFSGTDKIEEGDIEFTVPAHIFKYATGAYADKLTWPGSIPSKKDIDEMDATDRSHIESPFCYTLDESANLYEVTNWKAVNGGYKASIQLTFTISAANSNAVNVKDYVVGVGPERSLSSYRSDKAKFAEAALDEGGRSIPFQAKATLKKKDLEVVNTDSNIIYGQLDTWAEISTLTKEHRLYYAWDTKWGTEPAKEDGRRYLYAIFNLGITRYGVSQRYTVNYVDDPASVYVTDEDGNLKDDVDVEVIGYATGANTYGQMNSGYGLKYTDTKGVALCPDLWMEKDGEMVPASANGKSGLLSTDDFHNDDEGMLIRIDRAQLEDGDIVHNSAQAILYGDQNLSKTYADATDEFDYNAPDDEFKAPPGDYSLSKSGNSNGDLGVNSLLAGNTALAGNFDNYAYFASGPLTLEDGADPNDKEAYGKKSYSVELADDMFFMRGATSTTIAANQYDDYASEQRLRADEYAIRKAMVSYTCYDYVLNEQTAKWEYKSAASYSRYSADQNYVDIYLKLYEEGVTTDVDALPWQKVGKLVKAGNGKGFTVEPGWEDAVYGEDTYTNSDVYLTFTGIDVVGVKAVAHSDMARVYLRNIVGRYDSNIEIKSTEHTRDIVRQTEATAEEIGGWPYANIVDVNTLKAFDSDGSLVDLTGKGTSTTGTYRIPYAYYAKGYVNDKDANEDLIAGDEVYAAHNGARSSIRYISGPSSSITKTLVKQSTVEGRRIQLDYRVNAYERVLAPYWYDSLEDQFGGMCDYMIDELGLFQPQTDGTFYDLLPENVKADPDSVRVYGTSSYRGTSTPSSTDPGRDPVSVRVVENWRDSGRDMLIVDTSFEDRDEVLYSTGYTSAQNYLYSGMMIQFSAYLRYEDYVAQPKQYVNYVAYETDNELGIANGKPDDGNPSYFRSTAPQEIGDAYIDVNEDGSTESHHFLYAYAQNTIEQRIEMDFGLTKVVRGINASHFSKGADDSVWTRPGREYTYQLRLVSGEGSDTAGIVFYDSLENYVPLEAEQGYGQPSWKGTLTGVDTSSAQAMGAAPKVYYSEVAELDLDEDANRDLSDRSVWLPAEEYEFAHRGQGSSGGQGAFGDSADTPDLSAVKAVAVDLSQTPDGTDFIVPERQVVSVNLDMVAPDGDEASELISQHAHAYNNVYATAKTSQSDLGQWSALNTVHENYTQIWIDERYIDVDVEKQWIDDDDDLGLRPDSITVSLMKDEDGAAQKVDEAVLDEGNGWRHRFEHLVADDYDGDPIDYYVIEDPVANYRSEGVRVDTDVDDPSKGKDIGDSADVRFRVVNTLDEDSVVAVDLEGEKELYSEGEPMEMAKGQFSFIITPDGSNNDNGQVDPFGERPKTVSNDADGRIRIFDQLVYTTPGVFAYDIAEADGGETGFIYDQCVYRAIVTVEEDRDGKLTADVEPFLVTSGESDGDPGLESVDEVSFTNTYIPPATHGSIALTKLVDLEQANGDLPFDHKEFTFKVTGPRLMNGTTVPVGDGVRTFRVAAGDRLPSISFPIDVVVSTTEAHSSTVLIDDLVPGDYWVDEMVDGIAIEHYVLTVEGEGKVPVGASYEPTEVTVSNMYVDPAGNLTIRKVVAGDAPSATTSAKEFSFVITAPDVMAGKVVAAEDGSTVEFDDRAQVQLTVVGEGSITLTGLPNGTYSVEEVRDGADVEGYALDVTDEGDITLTDDSGDETVTITNTYSTPDDGIANDQDANGNEAGKIAKTGDGLLSLVMASVAGIATIILASMLMIRRRRT